MKGIASTFVLSVTAVFVLALFIAISGCGSSDPAEPESERGPDAWYAITVPAPDGQPVLCITNDLEDAISCDWAHR